MWGFTVDDALISIRYARHLASGVGYRFNADGPATDGVTPLPWSFLLVPLARASALTVLVRVKILGIVLHTVSAALVGSKNAPFAARSTALALLVACLPFGAYGPSGMDTPLATLFCTLCVIGQSSRLARMSPLFAGLAATIRPELLPWAATMTCGLALARQASAKVVFGSVLVSAAPFVACAVARRVAFGHFAPLAVLAKPSDLSHGLVYVVAAVLACGVPLVLVGPIALRRAPAHARVIVIAFVVHVVAVACAGGDSMPYARLFVPVIPSVLVAHLDIATVARRPAFWLRSIGALVLSLYVASTAGPRGRHVMEERTALIERAVPALRGAKHVAAVDIGWVSAATEADIVDLAGLTDPEIAALPGGHTSKHVSGAMLLDRDVDMLVLWATALPDGWGHAVAASLARDRVAVAHYVPSEQLPLGTSGAGYVLLRRR